MNVAYHFPLGDNLLAGIWIQYFFQKIHNGNWQEGETSCLVIREGEKKRWQALDFRSLSIPLWDGQSPRRYCCRSSAQEHDHYPIWPTTLRKLIIRITIPVKYNLTFLLGNRILKSYLFKDNPDNFPKSQERGVSKEVIYKWAIT